MGLKANMGYFALTRVLCSGVVYCPPSPAP